MNYKIIENSVVETKTGHKIISSLDMQKLRNRKRLLNMGGGFDGSTPNFIFQSAR